MLKRASKKTGARRGAPGDEKFTDTSTASEFWTLLPAGSHTQHIMTLTLLFTMFFLFTCRHVAIQDELPQRPSRPRRLPAAQRAHAAHLHPPHGEDRHLLPDGAQPGGPQHHLRGHRPPQPARLADHLPLWVLLPSLSFGCLEREELTDSSSDLIFFFFFSLPSHLQTMQSLFSSDCF